MRVLMFLEMQRFLRGGPAGPGAREFIMGRLDHELKLTREQHLTVAAQVKQLQELIKTFAAAQKPKLDDQVEKAITELASTLSGQQISRLRELKLELDRKFDEEQASQ